LICKLLNQIQRCSRLKSGQEAKDPKLKSLSKALETFISLKDLAIKFTQSYQMSAVGLQEIIQTIGKLTTLKCLALDVSQ